jgi:rod shape-determining protein MreC
MNIPSTRTLQSAVLALIVIGLLALALGGFLAPLSRILLTPILSAQTWLSTRFQALQEIVASPRDLVSLQEKNARLESENSALQSQVIELQEQLAEVQVLSALLDYRRIHLEHETLAAKVIAYDTNPFLRYVIIDRGSDDGLRRGMPVITHQGLVGRVAAVTGNAARVQLITDPASSINVRLKPSEADAMLTGSITGEISLGMILQNATVKVGDLVLTSSLGGNYPANLLIGQVASTARREGDLFQTASVQPIIDYDQLQVVLVITNFNPIDITPLIP